MLDGRTAIDGGTTLKVRGEGAMFVQIIEGRTSDAEGLKRQGERWHSEVRPGAIGFLGVTAGATSDGRAITIVRFESVDAARANSQRPEQGAWWAEMSKYFDGDPSFTESSEVDEFMGGGSNEAGFVQVMKSRGVDRSRVAQLDALFEKHAGLRPDVIGTLRVWTGVDTCVEAIYFTSEEQARLGEAKEMPAELQAAMAEFGDMSANTEFLDLADPILH
jgi:hypothetical protein